MASARSAGCWPKEHEDQERAGYGVDEAPTNPETTPTPEPAADAREEPEEHAVREITAGALRWSWRSCRAESRRAVADTARQPRVQRSPRPSSAPPSGSSSSSRRASRRSLTRPGSRTPVAFLAAPASFLNGSGDHGEVNEAWAAGCARTWVSHRATWRSSTPARPRGGYSVTVRPKALASPQAARWPKVCGQTRTPNRSSASAACWARGPRARSPRRR